MSELENRSGRSGEAGKAETAGAAGGSGAAGATGALRVAVVGGGASGLMCAIELAEAGAQVTVFEREIKPGKSILATGNGRCNISCADPDAELYHGRELVASVYRACPPDEVHARLEELGVAIACEESGRMYPRTYQAATVVDVLVRAAERAGVRFVCGVEVGHAVAFDPARGAWVELDELSEGDPRTLRLSVAERERLAPRKPGGAVRLGEAGAPRLTEEFDHVVFACGSAPGEVGAWVPLDVDAAPFEPRLLPLAMANRERYAACDGQRVRVALRARDTMNTEPVLEGELLFREYGISGIVAFDASRLAEPGTFFHVDFVPWLGSRKLRGELERRYARDPEAPLVDLLEGLLSRPVAEFVAEPALTAYGLDFDATASSAPQRTPEELLEAIVRQCKTLPMVVEGFGDARQAQVCRGGVLVEEVRPRDLALAKHPAVHVTGEALDVDGPCGGYNLHWAWTSGIVAARGILAAAEAN